MALNSRVNPMVQLLAPTDRFNKQVFRRLTRNDDRFSGWRTSRDSTGASDTSEIFATMCSSRSGSEPLYLSADNVAAKA